MSRKGRTPLPLPTLPAMPIRCTHHDTARDLKWGQAQCLVLPNGKHGNIGPFQASVAVARFHNPNAFPGLDDADSVIGFRLTGFGWQGVGEHMWPSVYVAYDAEIRPEHVQQAIETGEPVFVQAADPTTPEEKPMASREQNLDDRVMQALSDAGAQCGVCGDEPGERTCPDCERCYQRYVAALRKAGWAPRADVLREAEIAAKSNADAQFRHGEIEMGRGARGVESKLRAMAESAEQTPCSFPPCDAEAGEPCDRHEREQAHAEGEHCFCGSGCAAA